MPETEQDYEHLSARIPAGLKKRLDNIAWKERVPMTRIIMDALAKEVKRLEKKHAKADK